MPKISREMFDEFMVPNYSPGLQIPVRGEGSRLWDQEGREYVDFAGGIAVSSLGHVHPVLVAALSEQAGKLWHVSNLLANEPAISLARKLCEATFAERVFLCNSGGEANEAALKLGRRYAYDHHGAEKDEIIAFEQGFHGRTLFTVSVGGQANYREGFGPLPGAITHLPFNDVAALEEAFSSRTCAVMVEAIQGEGGVRDANPEFLEAIRRLCDTHDALMIMDEVQTGVGRTGYLYAYQAYQVIPDILTTAKALGGGFPVAAMLCRAEVGKSLGIGTHGSTYGGNALACAVAGAALDLINTPEVLNGVEERRQRIVAGLEEIDARQGMGLFSEIRGRGLLMGCVLREQWAGRAREFLNAAQAEGLLLLVAGADVIRMAPSLVIPSEDIDEGLARFARAVESVVASN
ncbi:MAG: acetylornithine/succinyldiaminopimelate transaminase [Arenicellales bacterium]|jgi:acetylornithine/N-succinyldiaminopimelate aminotransferase|nr:acetylornithine/succinyldiaminopimelate transaminase [Arenicellales bacterium]